MTNPLPRPVFAPALAVLAALWAAPLAPAQTNLQLGKMWTFEDPPLVYLERQHGFTPSVEWLAQLRLASLRFGGGCSASFVSPKGLILTNHHCVRDHIARVSPKDQDWVKNGFYAATLAQEVPIPGLEVRQLVSMQDVTAEIAAGVAPDDSSAAVAAKRAANEQKVLAEARAKHPDLEPQVVTLHQGAVMRLYLYRVYNDIRLVHSPHLQTAHFGGDPDNFTYPRYSIDYSFCRAYVNGAAADTSASYFRWSRVGPVEGELAFVTGNPGSTDRLKTKAQMDYMRDASYPLVRQLIDHRLAIMRDLAEQSEEDEKALRTTILQYENAQKAYRGYHEGLLDEELMARKVEAEAEFKAKVMADEAARQRFASVWAELEEVAALRTALEPQRRFHDPAGSPHLARALAVVRAVTDPDPAAREGHRRAAGEIRLDVSPFQRACFVDHLARAADWLPPTDPYRRALLDGRTPEQAAAMIESSAIADPAFVDQLIEGGEPAVKSSTDFAVQVALVLDPLVRARDKAQAWLAEQESALGAKVGQALFAVYGDQISPDATMTPRFSDGIVQGFPFNGTIAPFRTTFYGLYGRQAEFDGRHPFDLPQVWLDKRDEIDLTKSVNFVSSNDIIGGNSGSPIVNRDLEVIGLVFDGNMEMLANRFVYTDDVPRAVSVHVHAILEAMSVVYGATRVVDELLGAAGDR